jgi:hypothetical protein
MTAASPGGMAGRPAFAAHQPPDQAEESRMTTIAAPDAEADSLAASRSAPWPALDEGLLAGGRGKVPAFPVELLPAAWQVWTADRARGLSAPVDYVAQGVLGAVAAATGAGVEIRVTPEWSEPLVLWQALVGSCAGGAADVLERLRRMLETVESTLGGGHRGGPAAPGAAVRPALRLVVDPPAARDAIAELAGIVADNPRGVLLWCEEPSAWLADLGRDAAQCALWRRAWSGRPLALPGRSAGPPALRLERFAVGILGTLEPERLGQLDHADPGLAARFLYAWPQPAPFCRFGERRQSKAEESVRMLQRIEEQARAAWGPLVLEFEGTALAALEAFLARLRRATLEAEGAEAAWLGHGPANVVRLAAALELLAWSEGPATRPPGPIGRFALEAALALWNDYFRPHALMVLERALPGEADRRARRVVRWLKTAARHDVSGEEVRAQALARTVSAAQTAEVLERLELAGALRRDLARSGRPGRPAERWLVNPALANARGGFR